MKEKLLELQNNSYSPYFHYPVSAIVVMKDGEEFSGVNVENANGTSICAERNAIHTMITNGESKIDKIVCIDDEGHAGSPCGACRELIMQLDADSMSIEILQNEETYEIVTMEELMPNWWGYSRFEEENTN